MKAKSIIEEIYENTKYHNVLDLIKIAKTNATRTTLNISRDRRVSLQNDQLYQICNGVVHGGTVEAKIHEGLVLFHLDPEEGVYLPYQILSGSTIWPRVKGRCLNGVDIQITDGEIIEPVLDKLDPDFLNMMRRVFGIEGNIDDWSFNLKATKKKKVTRTRSIFDSATIEQTISIPQALTRMSDDERYEYNRRDRFLAYVFNNTEEMIVIDLGQLIDDGELNIRDLEELLTYEKPSIPLSTEFIQEKKKPVVKHADTPESIKKRIKFLGEMTNKDVKVTDRVYVQPDYPWCDFSDDDVEAFMKDKGFSEWKTLSDGTVSGVRKAIRGYSLFIGFTSDTDLLRSESWHYSIKAKALKDFNQINHPNEKPEGGKRVKLPV